MFARKWALIVVTALVAGLLPSAAMAGTVDDEQRLVDLVNQERSQRGVAALVVVPELVSGARAQAQRMADAGTLFHNQNLGDLIDGWYRLGENVGRAGDVEAVHGAFMGSPPHRDNLLLPSYDGVGVGVVRTGDTMYVAVVFMDSIEPLVFTPPFSDDDDSVHEADIITLAESGVTKGCGPTSYCPDRPVTRAEMATMLVRAFGLSGSAGNVFSDDDASVHESAIEILAHNGVTTGCGASRFCPDRPVSRAEMATFLSRVLNLSPGHDPGFDDISGNVHASSIRALASAGITKGCSDTSFCPGKAVTRAQMASFLVRSMDH